MSKIDSLTGHQRRAVRALLVKPTIEQAAKDAQVSETSLYRWMRQPEFHRALTEAESDALDNASRRLVNLTEHAISVITATMDDRNMHPALRLRAAQIVLENMLRLREMRSLEQRISALEQASERN
jgi:transposase-like protein